MHNIWTKRNPSRCAVCRSVFTMLGVLVSQRGCFSRVLYWVTAPILWSFSKDHLTLWPYYCSLKENLHSEQQFCITNMVEHGMFISAHPTCTGIISPWWIWHPSYWPVRFLPSQQPLQLCQFHRALTAVSTSVPNCTICPWTSARGEARGPWNRICVAYHPDPSIKSQAVSLHLHHLPRI